MTSFKGFVSLETPAFYILLLSTIAVLWWVAIWGITDALIHEIENRFRISKLKQYGLLALALVVFLMFHPRLLDHI